MYNLLTYRGRQDRELRNPYHSVLILYKHYNHPGLLVLRARMLTNVCSDTHWIRPLGENVVKLRRHHTRHNTGLNKGIT